MNNALKVNITTFSMQAADYLDIKSLLDLTCAKVASTFKGKTPEEFCKQFKIVSDFTPEEEARVSRCMLLQTLKTLL